MNNDIYYYQDQSLFNPIDTDLLDINQYLESNSDGAEIYEYDTNVNNRSVAIKSFYISQNNPQSFLFGNLNSWSNLALISNNQNSINSFFPSNPIFYDHILDNHDIFHFLYISSGDSNTSATSIYKTDIQSSFTFDYYPNPIESGQNLTLRFSSGIEVDDLKIEIFNIKGQLVKNISLGSFGYSMQDFNEISFSPFDQYLSSGLYILKIYLDNYIISKKIVYIKWKNITPA